MYSEVLIIVLFFLSSYSKFMSGLFHVGSLGPWTDVTGSIYAISMITSLGSFYWHTFKQSDSFLGSVQSTDEHIKAFFIFVTVFLISVIFFLFFHRISISLPILFIFSWISFTLSIRNLNMWFVISKSLYDDSQICVISVLVLKMALFFQILFFFLPFSMHLFHSVLSVYSPSETLADHLVWL